MPQEWPVVPAVNSRTCCESIAGERTGARTQISLHQQCALAQPRSTRDQRIALPTPVRAALKRHDQSASAPRLAPHGDRRCRSTVEVPSRRNCLLKQAAPAGRGPQNCLPSQTSSANSALWWAGERSCGRISPTAGPGTPSPGRSCQAASYRPGRLADDQHQSGASRRLSIICS